MTDAYIIDGTRTPFGRFAGALSGVRTDDLAAHPIRALMARFPNLPWEQVDDVIYGDANQAGEDNRNIARMAGLLAGLPVDVPGMTVNRLCGSGLEAVAYAARTIKASRLTFTQRRAGSAASPHCMPSGKQPGTHAAPLGTAPSFRWHAARFEKCATLSERSCAVSASVTDLRGLQGRPAGELDAPARLALGDERLNLGSARGFLLHPSQQRHPRAMPLLKTAPRRLTPGRLGGLGAVLVDSVRLGGRS